MSGNRRLKQWVVVTLGAWIGLAGTLGYLTYTALPLFSVIGLLGLVVVASVFSLMTISSSQQEVGEARKEHSRTKRLVQELHLKVDRYEYDAKRAAELRRVVINSTQEKDQSLRNMANALDLAMDELIDLSQKPDRNTSSAIIELANGMKRYAFDLRALAQMALHSEIPDFHRIDLHNQMKDFIDDWALFGESRGVAVTIEDSDESLVLVSDPVWLQSLLTRLAHAMIRFNENTELRMTLQRESDEAVRIIFSIDGRMLTAEQGEHLMTEYVSIQENGKEIGPGLTFVVARRIAQMLNGSIEIENTSEGLDVGVVLPLSNHTQEMPER